jgi:cation:H+ antiporter
MAIAWLFIVVGGLALYLGAEWLVKGAAGIARVSGLRPLVVGLTVVAYGTSAPEIVVGVTAALEGSGAIAVANSIGSNIANLGLILGLTALIAPPRIEGGLMRREIPVLVGTTALLPLILFDGVIMRLEALALAIGTVTYTWYMIRRTPPVPAETLQLVENDAQAAGAPTGESKLRLVVIAIVGFAVIIAGGKLFVDGAVSLARLIGISERVVGLTIVAIGTSLPELAACLVAALRGHPEIAVGNVLGSNIFNVLALLGVSGLVRPLHTELGGVVLDLAFVGAMTIFAAVVLRQKRVMWRLEGAVYVAGYVCFLFAVLLTR